VAAFIVVLRHMQWWLDLSHELQAMLLFMTFALNSAAAAAAGY
jgi:hypothetical protein